MNTVKWKLLLTHHHWAEWYCLPWPWNKEPGAETQQANTQTIFANGGGDTPLSQGAQRADETPSGVHNQDSRAASLSNKRALLLKNHISSLQ